MDQQWIRRRGNGSAEYETAVRPGDPGWSHTGLLVADLAPGQERAVATGACEYLVLPLSGGPVKVRAETAGGDHEVELVGREHPFAGPTDSAYVPRDAEVVVRSLRGGRVALCHATAGSARPFAVLSASEVPVEIRGAGPCTRQVQNFGTPDVLDADSIIACEVITPSGNWSSYPPHKHDEERPGVEAELEEIYYFQMRAVEGAPPGCDPVGVQVVYGTDERPIDVVAEVRSGDVVLVPHGWHGPSMTPPGYDMYYLNVMAGPGRERAWLICDDPAHGWVRDTWADQRPDPRLPLHEHRDYHHSAPPSSVSANSPDEIRNQS